MPRRYPPGDDQSRCENLALSCAVELPSRDPLTFGVERPRYRVAVIRRLGPRGGERV
jgi:hypothetical protein